MSDFVLINGYVLQFVAPLSQMGFIATNVRRGTNELSSVIEIFKTKPITHPSLKALPSLEKIKKVEFQNVSFGYEPSRSVLKDVSFCLEEGCTLGVVGVTGSGKSTLSNLLYNFYEANAGKILVNNENIQNFTTEQLSSLLGIIPQDIILFNTTIYENILFARPNARKEEIEEAIKLAHLEPVLKRLPHHYETIVGERGLKLSGGEKQRIAIARILLKRPSLYILDEATASLDIATEASIMKNIAPILKNATTIIIAHRLSTVVTADEILVFQHGSVKEKGTHSSLLKQQGLYASLWKAHEESHRRSYAA